jgi:uncharacterized membrane protein
VVPQVPAGQGSVQGSNIRLGGGAANVLATHSGRRYTTTIGASGLTLRVLRIGATLPRGSSPARVVVDGVRARSFQVRTTNRGVEVTARARGGGVHTVVVTAA